MAPKSELIRFALARGERSGPRRRAVAVIDAAGTMPGRGAYLCVSSSSDRPSPQCLELASKRGGFARALRCAVTVDPELVELSLK